MLIFLGIGAQKAGTTWLYEQMRHHPDIDFPRGKEAHFWDRKVDRDVTWYRNLFGDNRSVISGDITPAYAILTPDLIRECGEEFPDLRIIYILRNPIERAWSMAKMVLARTGMKTAETPDQLFIDHFRSGGSIMRGDYEQCLRNWLSVYPERQLLVCYYEDLKTQPETLLRCCFRHVGVEEDNYDWSVDLKLKVFASQDDPLPDHLRLELQRIYLPKIASLEKFLGKDLSDWS
jgi:hypothetical protein